MMRRLTPIALAVAAASCGPEAMPVPVFEAEIVSGNNQTVAAGAAVANPLEIRVTHLDGTPVAGLEVFWTGAIGSGTATPAVDTTDAAGISTASYTAGGVAGTQLVTANTSSASAVFSVHVVAAAAAALTRVSGNGQSGPVGTQLPQALVARVTDAFGNPVAGGTVSWAVTQGTGTLSAASSIADANGQVSTQLTPTSTGLVQVTATAGAVTAVFSATGSVGAVLLTAIPFTGSYHDQFVRDGIAFLSAWNNGLHIYDIGGGGRGGTPGTPVFISSIITATGGVAGGAQVHNAWWYHAPNGQKRYVFVGQEGPGSVGVSSSGDIHVVDISNINMPVEVASYRLAGAGVHNFWVDEQAEILYAAYYNGGIVALNVSGTLSGDLASREIARIQPGGAGNTYVWGVHLANGFLYANDMRSGFWQLRLNGGAFQVLGGGNNASERWGSDQWVHGGYAYSGTWGNRAGNPGNTLKIWRLDANGAPVLADSIVTQGIGTVSDVEVSADGKLLMFSAENGSGAGIYFYDLTASPTQPAFIGRYATSTSGVHTATFAEVGGRRYVVAARNSPLAAIFLDVTALGP